MYTYICIYIYVYKYICVYLYIYTHKDLAIGEGALHHRDGIAHGVDRRLLFLVLPEIDKRRSLKADHIIMTSSKQITSSSRHQRR